MHAVDTYIESLEEPTKTLVAMLRKAVVEAVPDVEERFSFKLPFYHYFGMFCYLHPNKGGVSLCILRGKDLLDAFPQLEQGNRATTASVTLQTPADLDRLDVRQILLAAADWNREAKRLKLPMVKRRGSA